MPDPVLGERVVALVQLSESAQSVETDEILDFATERLADYKVPEILEIVDQIPRNTLGKVDRPSVLAAVTNAENVGRPATIRHTFASTRVDCFPP